MRKYMILFFLLCIIYYYEAFASTIKTTIGLKSRYTSGISESNIEYKPFGKIVFNYGILKTEIEGMYIMNQQITDGLGNYSTINVGQGTAKGYILLFDIVECGGGYTLSAGQKHFESNAYIIDGSIDYNNWLIDATYTAESVNYDFNSIIDIDKKDFYGSISYDISDVVSVGIDYHYTGISFQNTDSYIKNIVSAGLTYFYDNFFAMGYVGIGNDSDDYMIYTVEGRLSIKIMNVAKIGLGYNGNYYQTTQTTSGSPSQRSGGSSGSGGSGSGGSGYDTYKTKNPYIKSSLIGKSFFDHGVSFSLSCSF